MRKIKFFKLAAAAYILLGLMHTLSQLLGEAKDTAVQQTMEQMKATQIQFMGQHTLMQFYTGFSLTMGLLIFAFGLQALLIKNPDKRQIAANIAVSAVAFVLAVIYFHLLAYGFIGFALMCFIISFFSIHQRNENLK